MGLNTGYHQSKSSIEEELEWVNRSKIDSEAFGFLYKKYHEQIFRYINLRMNDEELSFDVTAQVFIKALQNIQKYEFRGLPFSSWLYRIAKSELYQAFRDQKAQRTVSIETMHVELFLEDFVEDFSDDYKQILLASISELKEGDVALIELRFFEKRSFKEIGEILEIAENTAKVKCFRAVEKLKDLFFMKKERLHE